MLIEQDRVGSLVSAKITKLVTDREVLIIKRDKIEKKISHIDRVLRAQSRILDTDL